MTKSIRITIEGNDLDTTQDGDWTITIYKDGNLSGMSGLSGTPMQAFAAALASAKEAGINAEERQ